MLLAKEIKGSFKKMIGAFGYEIRGKRMDVKHVHDLQFDELPKLLMDLIKPEGPLTILDVGAHKGESVLHFRDLFRERTLNIHCFEPDPNTAARLKEVVKDIPNVTVNAKACGDVSGKAKFYQNKKTSTSSLHALDTNSDWARRRSATHGCTTEEFTEKEFEVEVTTLDTYVKEKGIKHIDLLKLDTQGHEPEVLAGALELLKQGKVSIIQSELILGGLYQRDLSFYDLEKILIPAGYHFFGIRSATNLIAHPDWGTDVTYIRGDLWDLIKKKKQKPTS